MVTIGNPPYLECSSAGEKHFSAFWAYVNGSSIETQYQAAKVFEDGSTGLHWRQAKGRKPINVDEVATLYYRLWRQYIDEHPELHQQLIDATGLSDKYGQPGHQCQAVTLWRIRYELIMGVE